MPRKSGALFRVSMALFLHRAVRAAAAAGGLSLFLFADKVEHNQPDRRRKNGCDDDGAEIIENPIHKQTFFMISL